MITHKENIVSNHNESCTEAVGSESAAHLHRASGCTIALPQLNPAQSIVGGKIEVLPSVVMSQDCCQRHYNVLYHHRACGRPVALPQFPSVDSSLAVK